MLSEIFAAVLGTIAFSILFAVPRKFYPLCGVIGGCSWIIYTLCSQWSVPLASFIAAMTVVLLSRIFSVWKHCPVTLFLIPGIFPLVPGANVYWTAFYFVTNEPKLASMNGYMAVKIAFSIVLGIVFVFEIPQKVFLLIHSAFRAAR